MPRTDRLTDAWRGRGKALALVGAAAALAGAVSAGTVGAASAGTATFAAARHAPAGQHATAHLAPAARPAPRRHPGPARRPAAPARPARPYLIYDSVTPTAIPVHHDIATYATGGYAVSPAQVAGRRSVLWIDTNGSDPRAAALDVEPGDATPSLAASWARHKLSAEPKSDAILYTMRAEWPAVQSAVATLPSHMRSHIRWWIADPTGVPHVVPGSNATQWYWGSNYDVTTANPGF